MPKTQARREINCKRTRCKYGQKFDKRDKLHAEEAKNVEDAKRITCELHTRLHCVMFEAFGEEAKHITRKLHFWHSPRQEQDKKIEFASVHKLPRTSKA